MSLTILEMVVRFADEFYIEIDTSRLPELDTYEDLLDTVEALIRADRQQPPSSEGTGRP